MECSDVLTAMEDDLLQNIAEYLSEGRADIPTAQWKIQQLASLGKLDKANIRTIAEYSGIAADMEEIAMTRAALKAVGEMDEGFGKLASEGIIDGTAVPMEESALQAAAMYSKQAQDRLNKVNTVMRYFAKNTAAAAVYKAAEIVNKQQHLDTLNKAAGKVIMGAESRQTAVRQCIKEMSERGIPAFVDAGGRQWSPEAYINMDVRTTCSNVAHEAQFTRMDDYNIDLLETSSHPGARPKCSLDQGKIFSRSGKNKKYPAWKTSSYGEPDGILGINCGHFIYPYIEGVSVQRYFPYDKEENDKLYKQKQEQRRLERDVRAAKREVSMLNAAGDKEGAKLAKETVKQKTAKYNEYCEKVGLPRKADRLTVQGYRTKAKDEKKALNILDKPSGNDIMKSRGYDFLDGVLGSDKISQEQSKSLDEIVSVIPKKHLDVIGKTVKEVEIVPNRGRCSYFPDSKKLVLDPDKMNGSIIHEFAHVLADAYDVYNDPKFLNILSDGLDLSNFGEVIYIEHPDDKGRFIFALPADKFINTYQGRIYIDAIDDWTAPIPKEKMDEYFSVGFDAYFNNAKELKRKDIKLYNYIKEMLTDE
ncbi:MAG: phage minor capsid protein [Oscillospiraceae bacterium]